MAAPRSMEIASPLDKGGLQGGERGNKPTPALRATPPTEGIFRRGPLRAKQRSGSHRRGTLWWGWNFVVRVMRAGINIEYNAREDGAW